MKKITSVLLFIYLCTTSYYSFAQYWMWANALQNTTRDVSSEAITTDTQGNSYVTGRYWDTTDFGNATFLNGRGAFVAKYDDNGSLVWVKGFTAVYPASCGGSEIALDTLGNVYVTGAFFGQVDFAGTVITPKYSNANTFITKLDSNGNVLWINMAGDAPPDPTWETSVSPDGIGVDDQGNAYITGRFSSKAKFSNLVTLDAFGSTSTADVFIAKYDSQGNFIWAKQAGGIKSDLAYGIATSHDGFSFITGSFEQTVAFDNVQLTCPSPFSNCTFVASYNFAGQLQWAKQSSTDGLASSSNRGICIATDNHGKCFVAGYFDGTMTLDGLTLQNPNQAYEIFIAMFDSHGSLVWGKKEGSSNSSEVATTISYNPTHDLLGVGGIYFNGNSTFNGNVVLPNYGSTDVFIARYAAQDGSFKSVTNIANTGNSTINCMSFNDNAFYVAGYFTSDPFKFYATPGGNVNFTLSPLNQGSGLENGYVAKYRLDISMALHSNSVENNIAFYPNPTQDLLTIKVEGSCKTQILLTTTMGEVLHTSSFEGFGEHHIDVSTIPDGLYVLKILSGEKMVTEHISINR